MLSQPSSITTLLDPRYIVPGDPVAGIYRDKDYYGNKIFYKSSANDINVLTIPTGSYPTAPQPSDFPNLDIILHLVAQLRYHIYDNVLIFHRRECVSAC